MSHNLAQRNMHLTKDLNATGLPL